MPAERFYLNAEYMVGGRVCLAGSEHHHLARVMRLRAGEEAEIVDGRGALANVQIEEVEKEISTLEILSMEKSPPPSPRLILAVPLMRPSKLEWVIEKGTELGADAFFLYPAERSEKEFLSERQLERLRILAISALKQSGRLFLPSLEIVADLKSLFVHSGVFLYGDTRPSAPLLQPIDDPSIVFITGPESGFSDNELKLLEQKARGVRLNPYTLRAETAPIAAMSILAMQNLG